MSDYPANITEIQDNIAVVAVVIPQQSLQTGLGFASITQGSGLGSLKTEDISIYYEPNSIPVAEVTSSILVPAAVLDYVTPGTCFTGLKKQIAGGVSTLCNPP